MSRRATRSRCGTGLERLLDLAFPARCAGCDREGPPVCAACLPALDARLELPPGSPIGVPVEIPAPLLQLEWCAPFGGTVRRALHRLKYAGEQRLAEPLGCALARRWRRAGRSVDLVVPVPIHAERARQRGYDQAVLLARVVACELGVPALPLLVRARATTPQFSLGRAARAGNVRDAFVLGGRAGDRSFEGARVLLIDDVVTTGATLGACGGALVRGGASAVFGATVARER